MSQNNKSLIIAESGQNSEKAQLYLDKITILKQIKEIELQQDEKPAEFVFLPRRLSVNLKLLLEDYIGYVCNFKSFSYNDQKGFFAFYNCAKQWLHVKFKDDQTYNDKLKELKLDEPYKLAIELFKAYIDFRKKAKQGAQFQNGYNNHKGLYKPNIYDLFTEDDLINLRGNEFIKDCYETIGEKAPAREYQLNEKPCIQNINSRTGEQLQQQEPVKPDLLYERVDNHLSWKIFKDGNIKKLNQEEKSMLQETMKNEKFGRHLKKLELKALPITLLSSLLFAVSAALIDMLASGAAFTAVAFMSTFATMAAYFSVPAILAFIIFTPILASMSRKSAIVDNMINISNQNKEFNNKLTKGEGDYKNYRDNNSGFLNPDKKEEEKNEIINQKDKDKEKSINGGNMPEDQTISIYKESNNKNQESQKSPLEMLNGLKKQATNNKEEDNKKEEKTGH